MTTIAEAARLRRCRSAWSAALTRQSVETQENTQSDSGALMLQARRGESACSRQSCLSCNVADWW